MCISLLNFFVYTITCIRQDKKKFQNRVSYLVSSPLSTYACASMRHFVYQGFWSTHFETGFTVYLWNIRDEYRVHVRAIVRMNKQLRKKKKNRSWLAPNITLWTDKKKDLSSLLKIYFRSYISCQLAALFKKIRNVIEKYDTKLNYTMKTSSTHITRT